MSKQNNLKTNTDSDFQKLLEDVAADEGLTDYKIEEAPGSIKGDGYMGVITAVQITGKTKSQDIKTLTLIVKSASKSDALRVDAAIEKVFEREIYMYDAVIPEFRKFQSEKRLAQFSNSAKCYKTCTKYKSEALVLQNLKEIGYRLWDRKVPMDDNHVTFVMAEYGRFHALSFALHQQQPERYKKLIDPMDDVIKYSLKKTNFIPIFEKKCLTALASLNPTTDKEAIVKLKAFHNEITPFFYKISELNDDYSVILHGDCWTNNMMFKYDDINNPKKPTHMCLLDLQIARIAPPVFDIAYYFYCCAPNKIIDNWEYYLDVYYKSMSTYLKELGTDVSDVYPYAVFRQHWKAYSKYGLIFAMLLIHIMLSEQNEVTDFVEVTESGKTISDVFDYNISNTEEYNNRIRHVILHFTNNNLI